MKNTNTLKGMKANLVGILLREVSVANYYAVKNPELWPDAKDRYKEARAAARVLAELADFSDMDVRFEYVDENSDTPRFASVTVDDDDVVVQVPQNVVLA